jgi:ATP-binding cassette, subfamily C (CFTR/MRP), member 1
MISQFAQNEQNMNAVERVLHYSELSPEGDATTPNDPPMSWPEKGHISFIDVEMSYREGLPLVLKGVTFQVRPGEKVNSDLFLDSSVYIYPVQVGIVGRTGAGNLTMSLLLPLKLNITLGKSSLLQALFR